MAKISELSQYYKEEVIKRVLHGTLIDSSSLKLKEGQYLYFQEQSSNVIKFTIDDKIITVKLNSNTSLDESTNPVNLENIYWISQYSHEDSKIEISRLKCPNGKVLLAEQNLCISNEYIQKLPSNTDLSRRIEQLKDNLVFYDGKYYYLLIETYPISKNGTAEITIHGIHSEATVRIQDGKWVITKSTKPKSKNLSRKYEKYLSYYIQRYAKVNIYEESEAKLALNELEIQEQAGNTLLALWDKYSEIELKEKENLRDQLKAMQFSVLEPLPNGVTRIRLNVSDSVWNTFYQHRSELVGERLEFATQKGKAIKIEECQSAISREESEDDEEFDYNPFIIKKIGKNRIVEVSDECYLINNDGFFILSTKGNQTMDERRKYARKKIIESDRNVLRALYLAIEGKAESIFSLKRESLEPTTDRTRAYLKKNFGIDDLTKEQKKAVSIALNSPDIALIQGPPGTGKTTVIAAICDRLEEEADKAKEKFAPKGRNINNDYKKLFLLSAFQNDTVEHIATKINTYGIPTPKIGKDAGTIKAEEKFINQLQNTLELESEKLKPINDKRVSKILLNLQNTLTNDKASIPLVKKTLGQIVRTYDIPIEFRSEWEARIKLTETDAHTIEKWSSVLNEVVTSIEAFMEKGKKALVKLSIQKMNFTQEERSLMMKLSTAKSITEDDLKPLAELKTKYLNIVQASKGTDHEDDYLFLHNWIEQLRLYFIAKEESSYSDLDTFLAAVIESIRDDLRGNPEHILSSLKEYSRSIAATNQASGSKKVSDIGTVHSVILEEAARSNPLDLLIPMTRADDRIIMVGDQMQLPHILEPRIADEAVSLIEDEDVRIQYRKAYEESLFGRIFHNVQKENVRPQRYYTLKEQFRMHPTIGNFVSEVYYNNELKCYYSEEQQAALKTHGLSFPLVKDKAAIFVDVPYSKGAEVSQRSKYRMAECFKVMEILDSIFMDPNSSDISVGIITFYRQQRDELFKLGSMYGRGYTEDGGEDGYSISQNYKYTNEKTPREKLRIGSVDSFQGKEFDVVILSTVRSNNINPSSEEDIQRMIKQYRDKYKKDISPETAKDLLLRQKYGFLMLDNRLNVAFSRAQKLLITVGDGNMFNNDDAEASVKGLYEFYKNFSCEKK